MTLDISSYDAAIRTLIKLGLRPYWDSTANRVFFRGAGKRQRGKDWVDAIVAALHLYTKEDAAKVRIDIKRLAK